MSNILVIEDDKLLNAMIRMMLLEAGHETEGAHDGGRGLQLLATTSFNLVVTDIVMPEKEGLETILAIRKTRKTLPIIAISGGGNYGAEDYLGVALELGADYAFQKPLDKGSFLGAVRECLKGIERSNGIVFR
jgi:DNA-binding response OmpR family regulator